MPSIAPSRRITRYWEQYVASLPLGPSQPQGYVGAFYFGTKPNRAEEITKLVLDGRKTATGALLWALEHDGDKPAEPGDYWIVANGAVDPACIIQTTHARIIPFDEVGEEYARWGGEGDGTLANWRAMYWSYIVGECVRIGRSPESKAPLVMERFEVVYAEPLYETTDC